MTKAELSQYRKLGKEIALLENQLEKQQAELDRLKSLDVVHGSLPDFPFIYHNIPVDGGDPDDLRVEYRHSVKQLRQTIRERQRELRRLEQYIAGIQDSEVRQIFVLRYMGPERSWEQVAHKLGPGYSGEATRKRHDRYLKYR